MSTYAVTDTQMSAIADAIRTKRDITTPLTVDEMPLQIGLIDGGGGGGGLEWHEKTLTFDSDELVTTGTGERYGRVIDDLVGVQTFVLATLDNPRTPTVGSRAFQGVVVMNGVCMIIAYANSNNTSWTQSSGVNGISNFRYNPTTGCIYGFSNYGFISGITYTIRYFK